MDTGEFIICGIVGLFTKINTGFSYKHTKILEQLLHIDTLRGGDSTGLFAGDKNGEDIYLHKMLGSGQEFVKSKGWDMIDSYLYSTGKFAVGHNRSATIGGVSEESAHPFHHGHITLVHNGTLKEYSSLKKGNTDITVDSEAICYALSKTDNWQDVLPEIHGAFQLVWYDHKKKALFFAGNGDRPFWYAYTKDGNSVYFASEWQMLSLTADRNGEELFVENGYTFYKHEKNTVMSIPIDFTGDLKTIPTESFKGYVPFFPPVVVTQHGEVIKDHFFPKKKQTTTETKKMFGKTINWEVADKYPIKNSTDVRIKGYQYTDDQEEVSCVVSAELAATLEIDDPIYSTVKKVINRKVLGVLYISNPDIESLALLPAVFKGSKTTRNGEVIYKEDWDATAPTWKQCGSCADTVTWEEVGDSDISYMGGRIPKYCLCARCTADFYGDSQVDVKSWKN